MAVIVVNGLSKRFGDKMVVRDISFRVEPGRVTSFLGPNGAGKSTTMRLMLELDHGKGVTLFDGKRYGELDNPVQRVGALLDARSFHPRRSARSHLRMIAAGSRIGPHRVDEVLDLVGLSGVAGAHPKGFSLGMGQRLGLAAALLGRPDTLILDEPANGMDPHGMQWLREFLRKYASEGNTVFVSSHLLAEIETVADQVIVIGQGRLIADCPLAAFIEAYQLETVRVRSDHPARLAEALGNAGGVIQHRAADLLTVSALTKRQVAEVAAAQSCLVSELFTTTATLEEAFLRASAGSVEFETQAVAAPAASR